MALDDLIAIAVLLRDPAVDVRAITVEGTGEAHCLAGAANAARLAAAFGRADLPVGCGRETPGPAGRSFPNEWRQAADSMYGLTLPAAPVSVADAVDVIAQAATDAGGYLTIVAIGPWTNLADVFAEHPELEGSVAAIHAMGGAFRVDGNIEQGDTHTPDGVEWNLGADPAAVAAVLETAVPITFVPLDATNGVPGTPALAADIAADTTAAGADMVNQLFETVPYMMSGNWYIWDPLAALTLTQPDLILSMEGADIEVTTTGPQAGRLTLVDPGVGRPINYARSADSVAVYEALAAALQRGDPLVR
jgi:pyrimidine-specific ribonucleoside hydrolase